MGLVKETALPNGVPVKYHRIASLTVVVNNQNIIEVSSYIDLERRIEEREAQIALAEYNVNPGSESSAPSSDVFINTTFFNAEYDPSMSVESAYEWLKQQPMFEGAQDETEFSASDIQSETGQG